jgi:hypothetical protein
VLAWIDKQDTSTLGTRLASAFLKDEEDSIPDILMSAREAILALPKARQADWSFFVREIYDSMADIPTENAALAGFLTKLHTTKMSDNAHDIDAFLAAAVAPRRNHHNPVIRARDLIIRLFESEPHDTSKLTKSHEVIDTANAFALRGEHQSTYRSRPQVNQAEIQLMNQLINSGDLESQSRAYISFALDRYAREPDPKFGTVAIHDSILRELSTGLSKQLASETASGTFPPIPSVHALLTDWFGQRDLSLVSGGMVSSTALPELEDLEEAVLWLGNQPADDVVARTMEISVRRLRAQRQDEPIQAPDPIVTAANVALIEDASRPLIWRLALTIRLISAHPSTSLLHDSFRMACGEALLAAWQDRRIAPAVESSQAATILKSLSTPHKTTEPLKTLCETLVEAWLQAKSPSRNPNQYFSQEEIQQIFALALSSNADRPLRQLIIQYPIQLLNTATPLANLIEAKRLTLAKELVSQFGSRPFTFLQGTSVNYNRDLEAGLPEFLAEVDDLDTRFFLELLFKSQADNKEEGATPEKERTVRLQEFLPQLAEHSFTQHRHLRRCLTLTQQEPLRFRAELTPMIDRAVKNLDITSVLQIKDSSLKRQWVDLIGLRIAHHAALGNPVPFTNAISLLKPLQLKDPYLKRQTHDKLGATFVQGATHFSKHAEDRSTRTALLPAYRSLAFDGDIQKATWVLQALVAYAEFEKLSDYDAAFQTRFEKLTLTRRTRTRSVASILEQVLPPEAKLPDAERMRITLAVYEHPLLKNIDASPLQGITIDEVFSDEDLLAYHELILSNLETGMGSLKYS